MTTNTNSNPSALSRTRTSLKARTGIRYAITGVVLLAVGLVHVISTADSSAGFGGNNLVQLAISVLGVTLVVTGIVKACRR